MHGGTTHSLGHLAWDGLVYRQGSLPSSYLCQDGAWGKLLDTEVNNYPGGGTHMSEVSRYMCRFYNPPFQAPLPLQRPTFLHLESVLTPSVLHFSKKFTIFRPVSLRFWQNYSCKHTYFSENLFPRP